MAGLSARNIINMVLPMRYQLASLHFLSAIVTPKTGAVTLKTYLSLHSQVLPVVDMVGVCCIQKRGLKSTADFFERRGTVIHKT